MAELGHKTCQKAGKKRVQLCSPGVVGALLLQLPIPEDVTHGRNRVDGACQRLGGAILVRVHRRDQRFLTNLGWDWRWEKPLLNCQLALRYGKSMLPATKAYIF